jgi:hypothetical protein
MTLSHSYCNEKVVYYERRGLVSLQGDNLVVYYGISEIWTGKWGGL